MLFICLDPFTLLPEDCFLKLYRPKQQISPLSGTCTKLDQRPEASSISDFMTIVAGDTLLLKQPQSVIQKLLGTFPGTR